MHAVVVNLTITDPEAAGRRSPQRRGARRNRKCARSSRTHEADTGRQRRVQPASRRAQWSAEARADHQEIVVGVRGRHHLR